MPKRGTRRLPGPHITDHQMHDTLDGAGVRRYDPAGVRAAPRDRDSRPALAPQPRPDHPRRQLSAPRQAKERPHQAARRVILSTLRGALHSGGSSGWRLTGWAAVTSGTSLARFLVVGETQAGFWTSRPAIEPVGPGAVTRH